jgi:uncharacterized repeat protein (TIGR01451 family)
MDLRAWSLTPAASLDHDAIVAAGNPDAVQLQDRTVLNAGTEVWLTYTVANTGNVNLHNVVVTDSSGQSVCVLPVLFTYQTKGCSRRGPTIA